jgi:peptidoglycan/LPS O-acetylase OafA/YrhL
VPRPVSHKIQNIQALRGVAVLLIVFYHMVTIEQKFGGSTTLLPNFVAFGTFGVDLFFVISGFVMVTVTRGKFQNTRQAFTFLYHRISRIYPLYWLYSLLVLVVLLVQPTLVNSSQGGHINISASFLLLPQQHLPLLMVGWTLVHEVYFYLVFFLLLFLPEKYLVAGLGLWTVVILLFQTQTGPTASPLLNLTAHPLTLEFIGGCLLARHTGRKKSTLPAVFFTATALCVTAAAVLCFAFAGPAAGFTDSTARLRILYMGLPALIIVYCMVRAEQQHAFLPGPLCTIGDISYSIYLSHVLTLNLIGRIWAAFALDSTVDNWLVLPVMPAAVIGVGAVSYTIIERPMIKASRKIA